MTCQVLRATGSLLLAIIPLLIASVQGGNNFLLRSRGDLELDRGGGLYQNKQDKDENGDGDEDEDFNEGVSSAQAVKEARLAEEDIKKKRAEALNLIQKEVTAEE